jgi:hypothetical protein
MLTWRHPLLPPSPKTTSDEVSMQEENINTFFLHTDFIEFQMLSGRTKYKYFVLPQNIRITSFRDSVVKATYKYITFTTEPLKDIVFGLGSLA